MGHRQTTQNQIRWRKTWCLIRFSTVCFCCLLLLFLKLTFCIKFFHEKYQSVKWFGSRSGQKSCRWQGRMLTIRSNKNGQPTEKWDSFQVEVVPLESVYKFRWVSDKFRWRWGCNCQINFSLITDTQPCKCRHPITWTRKSLHKQIVPERTGPQGAAFSEIICLLLWSVHPL